MSSEKGVEMVKNTIVKEISDFYISREEEIKKKGIIPYLTVAGDKLMRLSLSENISKEDREVIYGQYLYMFSQDIEMIEEQKKLYGENLPGPVYSIVTPVENNILQIMKKCLYSIDNYILFICEEEKDDELILEAMDILKDASSLVYETEDMLEFVIRSAEETDIVISEA